MRAIPRRVSRLSPRRSSIRRAFKTERDSWPDLNPAARTTNVQTSLKTFRGKWPLRCYSFVVIYSSSGVSFERADWLPETREPILAPRRPDRPANRDVRKTQRKILALLETFKSAYSERVFVDKSINFWILVHLEMKDDSQSGFHFPDNSTYIRTFDLHLALRKPGPP